MSARRIVVIASASGNGKTTLAAQLATRLGLPLVELDAWVHGPAWTETPDVELRARLAPVLAGDGWVVDGTYERKLGTLVLDHADLIIWLDLSIRVWLPRLLARSARRIIADEPLWNGNRETWGTVLWGRRSLLGWALRSHHIRRRSWPLALARYPVMRLRTPGEVDRLLRRFEP